MVKASPRSLALARRTGSPITKKRDKPSTNTKADANIARMNQGTVFTFNHWANSRSLRRTDLNLLRNFAAAFFALPVRINDAVSLQGLPIKHRDRDNGIRQLLSLDVLRWLEPQVPPDAHCLLAVTMEDLYPKPSWNFVFGQASLNNRVGVFSFARYVPSFAGKQADQETKPLMFKRSCKVLAHETGHMFGIKHCVHFDCLMNGSNHLAETDARPMCLCPVCLRKLHWGCKFDVTDRYKQLQRFSASVGWHNESEWFKRRLTVLTPTGD